MCHERGTPECRDPALLTASFIEVRSTLGRLLFDMLPHETAQQWVAEGQAYVEAPNAIRSYDGTHTRDECTPLDRMPSGVYESP
jgi:hypothetical protein